MTNDRELTLTPFEYRIPFPTLSTVTEIKPQVFSILEVWSVVGNKLTVPEILAAYNRGIIGKNFLETGYEVAWYKFKGNNNTDFLSDETGDNDLTGTNVTQSDDQVKLKRYAD